MKCPVCEDSRMREVEKDGVLIDVCPSCKGVWLDRGELDKLMQGMREMQAQYDRMERHVSSDDTYNRMERHVGSDDRYDRVERHVGSDDRQWEYRAGDYSHGNSGYDKHGRPYKKKKTMFDVLGDLFE
ncbi:zf-TFIIB domain-containing protein [Paenibacillus sp. sptzw28]|uniref:TFIIB-type zinc ribbon-containing protein n=1 Tax=Paenibacillus sp. sptzw28 TaxID=715179 RepID=UPI001C6DDA2F|nr:zf-TFIIB domain-containing protein [Paenibacillus sp. sptzw28]